jgi:aminomethyltransferase
MNQKTPLFSEHVKLGAKMCPFAGYDMPIQYPFGVIKEHEWVRENAGIFDVSHMGQAFVKGAAAAAFFSRITPSSFAKTPHGRAKYTVLTNDNGGIIDDLIITRMDDDKFFVVFNAGRKDVDRAWMQKNLPPAVSFEELANNALIALQGPKAESALQKLLPSANLAAQAYMTILESEWQSVPVLVSRLGYTGEDGFEISIPANYAAAFWNKLLENSDVKPIGLAARDSLRLEMGYSLYGHDLTEETNPIEASLSWVMTKGHQGYFGAGVLVPAFSIEPARKRVGIKLTGQGIAREGAEIFVGTEKIGTLTSGGFSPSLKQAIGQGYITSNYANEGQAVEVEVRAKRIPAVVHALSFMPAKTKSTSLKKAS